MYLYCIKKELGKKPGSFFVINLDDVSGVVITKMELCMIEDELQNSVSWGMNNTKNFYVNQFILCIL